MSTQLPLPRLMVYLHRGTQLNQGGAQDSGGVKVLEALGSVFQLWGPPSPPPPLTLWTPPCRVPPAALSSQGPGASSALLWVPGWGNAL